MAKSATNEEFLITDPAGQPGVVLEVEPGVRPLQLLEPYSAAADVNCAFCQQRQLHRHGYLAQLPDGRLALCGNVCAEEFFDKQTVGLLDRKRDQLAGARHRREQAATIVAKATDLLPIIDQEIAPDEWAAEEAMVQLGFLLSKTARERILKSDVNGVRFLGKPCRAFGDARGGIASIASKAAGGVTDKEAEKLLEKRALVISRIAHGIDYLAECAAFFETRNLQIFKNWLRENPGLHGIRSMDLSNMDRIMLRCLTGNDWSGRPAFTDYQIEIPSVVVPDQERLLAIMGW